MALVPFSHFGGSSLRSLQREMDRLFDRFFEGYGDIPTLTEWTPPVDIAEESDHYLITTELPGIPKDNVEISFENGILTLRGEKKQTEQKKEKHFHRTERIYGRFERCLSLPQNIDADRIEASYRDGVLQVVVPKNEKAKPKAIPIKVEA